MAVSPLEQEIRLPDGRVALAPTAQIGSANYTNGDLAPLPIERRTWSTYNYAALWIGMSPWTQWLSFGIFWVLEMAIILRGMDTLRRFENWAAPFVLVVAVALLIFMVIKANGFGGILSEPSRLGWGSHFWPVFFPSLMGMIAFCWVVGFATALILYTALSMFSPQRQLAPATAPAS